MFISVKETRGLVLVEAMAANIRVVAAETPGSIYVLAGVGGLLVLADDDAYGQAVLTFLEVEGLRKKMDMEACRLAQPFAI